MLCALRIRQTAHRCPSHLLWHDRRKDGSRETRLWQRSVETLRTAEALSMPHEEMRQINTKSLTKLMALAMSPVIVKLPVALSHGREVSCRPLKAAPSCVEVEEEGTSVHQRARSRDLGCRPRCRLFAVRSLPVMNVRSSPVPACDADVFAMDVFGGGAFYEGNS